MIARAATKKYERQDGLSTSLAVGVYMLPCLSSARREMDPRNAFAIFWGSFGITSNVYLAAPDRPLCNRLHDDVDQPPASFVVAPSVTVPLHHEITLQPGCKAHNTFHVSLIR